tara:strand:- start:4787 stop:5542 length:756 start_codon:yes stop_codon:yes gene_type:complete
MADQNRGNDVSRSANELDDFRVGIKDIDTAIYYYFNEVIKPSVIQNGKTLNVPVVYGSPERWKAMQNDGFYRDKNGKMQAPLIVFRRETVEKNRNIGNKLDGNNPRNFGVFKQSHSKKNVYDRFSAVNNRVGVDEYFAVAIPDYVNITYSCVIFTDYVEQNNKLVEAINFASDSYWGDPSRFKFRAMIDTYTTSTELVQGSERIVKSNFNIMLLGHIVTDTINALAVNSKKYFSKAAVKITSEVVKNINDL